MRLDGECTQCIPLTATDAHEPGVYLCGGGAAIRCLDGAAPVFLESNVVRTRVEWCLESHLKV